MSKDTALSGNGTPGETGYLYSSVGTIGYTGDTFTSWMVAKAFVNTTPVTSAPPLSTIYFGGSTAPVANESTPYFLYLYPVANLVGPTSPQLYYYETQQYAHDAFGGSSIGFLGSSSGIIGYTGATFTSWKVEKAFTINGRKITSSPPVNTTYEDGDDAPQFEENYIILYLYPYTEPEPAPVCLLSDCDILTENGYKNITSLTESDKVMGFFSHDINTIIETNRPYTIGKSAMSENVPDKDIHLSGHHRIVLKNKDSEGYTGVQTFKLNFSKSKLDTETVVYYNIKLEDPVEAVIVNGLVVESYQEKM